MTSRIIVGMVAFSIATVAVIVPQQAAQTESRAAVSFEVASLKRNKSGERGGSVRRQPGGRVNAINMPLNMLITLAYQVQPYMLAGGPGWIADERFDIVAKLDVDPPPMHPGGGPDPLALAMQTLLADRCKLKVHHETREGGIYALVMARPGVNPGPALKPSTQDCSPEGIQARRAAPSPAATSGTPPVVCGMQMAPGRIGFAGFPLSIFATGLGGQVGRVVVDRTGLAGNWDLELTFAPERPAWLPPVEEVQPPDPNTPSIFTALQEQLGLKLQATKGPVDILVIDHVERPSDE